MKNRSHETFSGTFWEIQLKCPLHTQKIACSYTYASNLLTCWYLTAVAARGENGQEGCEISYLLEHIGLSPWLFLLLVAFPVTSAVLILSNLLFSVVLIDT